MTVLYGRALFLLFVRVVPMQYLDFFLTSTEALAVKGGVMSSLGMLSMPFVGLRAPVKVSFCKQINSRNVRGYCAGQFVLKIAKPLL